MSFEPADAAPPRGGSSRLAGRLAGRPAETVRRGVERVGSLEWFPDARLVLGLYLLLDIRFWHVTTMAAHHRWAVLSVPAYAAAFALAVLRPRRRVLPVAVALIGVVVVPLVDLVATGLMQPEVLVVIQGARQATTTGGLYVDHPTGLGDYRPYLPSLFSFGLPAVVPGLHRVADPRVVALLLLLAVLVTLCVSRAGAADVPGRLARSVRRATRTEQFVGLGLVLCFPTVALALSTSFIDVPQAALTLLALFLVGRGNLTAAGLVVGVCLGTKPTELCVLFVLLLWVGRTRGRRPALRLLLVSSAAGLATIVPFAVLQPEALWTNVVLFPAGRAASASPADSPLPGVLLNHAVQGTDLSWLAPALLVVVGLAFAAACVRWAPRTMTQAAAVISIGLCLAFLLAPQSRTGYFVVPVIIFFCVRAVERATPAALAGRQASTAPVEDHRP